MSKNIVCMYFERFIKFKNVCVCSVPIFHMHSITAGVFDLPSIFNIGIFQLYHIKKVMRKNVCVWSFPIFDIFDIHSITALNGVFDHLQHL